MKLCARLAVLWAFACSAFGTTVAANLMVQYANPQVIAGPSGIGFSDGCWGGGNDDGICAQFTPNFVISDVGVQFTGGIFSINTQPQNFTGRFDMIITTDAYDADTGDDLPDYQGPVLLQIGVASIYDYDTGEGTMYGRILNYGDVLKVNGPPILSSSVEMLFAFGTLDFLGFGSVVDGNGVVSFESPVPEPSTALLLLPLAVGLALRKRLI